MLAKDDRCVVSERMLVYILYVSVDHEMFWAEAALALTPLCGDFNLEVLLRPFLSMWLFKN